MRDGVLVGKVTFPLFIHLVQIRIFLIFPLISTRLL